MRRILLIAFAVLLLLPVQASAQLSNATFIPSMISEGASFLAIADWPTQEPIRISWILYETGAHGHFPLVDDKFVCYFSNTDYKANCGPSPFPIATIGLTPYEMYLEAVDSTGVVANNTQFVDVGSIGLTINTQLQDNNLYLVVAARGALPAALSYSVYQTDLTPVSLNQPLVYDIATDRFSANTTLADGEYYIAIWGAAPGGTDWGGDLLRIQVGVPGVPGVPAVPGVVQAEPVIIKGALLTRGADYTQTGFTLTNIGTDTVGNLSVSVPGELASYLSVILDTTTLDVNESTFFTVQLTNVQYSMQINTTADILSNGQVVGGIPISIGVSILGAEGAPPVICPPCPPVGVAGNFTLSPSAWSGTYLVDVGATQTITITSAGPEISGLGFQATGELSGIATAELPETVPAGGTGTATVTVAPFMAGSYTGSLVISSDQGSQAVLASLDFFPDLSIDIESARLDLQNLLNVMEPAQAAQFSGITDDITDLLDDAETDLGLGDYQGAQEGLQAANAKLDVLTSVAAVGIVPGITPAVPADMTGLLLIVVIVVVIGAAVWFYFKRVRKPKKLEEELEEEF